MNIVPLYVFFTSDIDECLDYACPAHAYCNNTIGSFTCTCQQGFYKDVNTNVCLGKGVLIYIYCFKAEREYIAFRHNILIIPLYLYIEGIY